MKDFFVRFKYLIIFAVFLTIVSIFFVSYKNTKEIIKDKYKSHQKMVEKSILQTIKYRNYSYKIAEKQLNQEMKKYSLLLRDKYRRNQNVLDWNLEQLKKEFNGYDIYIIDRNLKVIRSTLKKDIGLDFSKYSGFSKLLKKRLQGDSFAVDRLNLSINTGKIKKYSYIPTHNHKYLLELSINVKKKFPVLKNLSVFTDAVDITKKYESVEEISFYKFNPDTKEVAKLRNTKKPYVNTNIRETEKRLVRKTFLSKQVQTNVGQTAKDIYVSKYIPALMSDSNSEKEWWNTYIVGITYNNQAMFEEISEHRRLILINVLIMVVVFVSFILIVIYLLRKFEYMAYHDRLTGLPNRESFADKLGKMMMTAEKNNDKLAILFLDIDGFKDINDNFGHNIGDELLEKTAYRLKDSLRKGDAISRLGGDEFAIAASEISSNEEATKVAARVIDKFKKPLIIQENEFFINISIGISIYPENGNQLEELIKKADYAMYEVKEKQRDYGLYEE